MKHVYNALKQNNIGKVFMGVEPFVSGDLHIHGLISGRGPGWLPEVDPPKKVWDNLFHKFGRARVENCHSLENVSGYCSKYIMKKQNGYMDHYDFFGDKNAWLERPAYDYYKDERVIDF